MAQHIELHFHAKRWTWRFYLARFAYWIGSVQLLRWALSGPIFSYSINNGPRKWVSIDPNKWAATK